MFQIHAPSVIPLVSINFVYAWLTDWWRDQFLIIVDFFYIYN